jgi:hypothetical protein
METGSGLFKQKQNLLSAFEAMSANFVRVILKLQACGSIPVSISDPGNFYFVENAPNKVNTEFWRLLEAHSLTEPDINRHIICALLELAVVAVKPMTAEKPEFTKWLNTRLAYHCAISFIARELNVNAREVANYVENDVAADHLAWLNCMPVASIESIISNKVYWRLVEKNFMLRRKIKQL